MILLKGERHAQINTGSGGDDVVLAFDLPAQSILRGFEADLHIIGTSLALEREKALGMAVAAYVIELDDPDTADTYDDIWDRFVVNYTDVDTIDLDTVGTTDTAFWEPGEADFETLFHMGDQPKRLFMRRRMLTFADPGNAGYRFQPSETPFEPQWFPAERMRVASRENVYIRKPSVCLIGIAQPAYDDTATTRTHLTENEWGQVQYMESTLERSLVDQLNIVEAGAEVPWENSSALMRKHMAPNVFEATAGAFITGDWNVFATMQFQHTVPGSMDFSVVDVTP